MKLSGLRLRHTPLLAIRVRPVRLGPGEPQSSRYSLSRPVRRSAAGGGGPAAVRRAAVDPRRCGGRRWTRGGAAGERGVGGDGFGHGVGERPGQAAPHGQLRAVPGVAGPGRSAGPSARSSARPAPGPPPGTGTSRGGTPGSRPGPAGRTDGSRSWGEYVAVVAWDGDRHRVASCGAGQLERCGAFGRVDLLPERCL